MKEFSYTILDEDSNSTCKGKPLSRISVGIVSLAPYEVAPIFSPSKVQDSP
jgi:hypothetical protein